MNEITERIDVGKYLETKDTDKIKYWKINETEQT